MEGLAKPVKRMRRRTAGSASLLRLKPERTRDLSLARVQCEKGQVIPRRRQEQRIRQMPQVSALDVPTRSDPIELLGERPVWVDPRDPRQKRCRSITHSLPHKSRPQFGFEKVRGKQPITSAQSSRHATRRRLAKGDGDEAGRVDVK